ASVAGRGRPGGGIDPPGGRRPGRTQQAMDRGCPPERGGRTLQRRSRRRRGGPAPTRAGPRSGAAGERKGRGTCRSGRAPFVVAVDRTRNDGGEYALRTADRQRRGRVRGPQSEGGP